ncbi:MAG: DUF4065 domain-containing protein [Mesorhizobium sp.]|uniref:Panacea domain-containing protein n=1 Tax=Mesorhizobium sp. TaxID=1871066 RepID=UPI001224FEB5|nr:type II toxin-antitoxin system antitoxin SocA domain-containing protein [Mesorhizobium sp.]TIL87499.1 MAG: DUF4065 domain-containing protein [Mesorhizobium sp.]
MPSAIDVAQYILERIGPLTVMKVQKLVYYSQAWSIVWDDNRLFPEPIEAWKNGPVVRSLWEATRGQYRVASVPGGNAGNVGGAQRETVNRVLDFYGVRDAQWLSDLTHMEAPWAEAYKKGQNTEIPLDSIAEYYSSLMKNAEA